VLAGLLFFLAAKFGRALLDGSDDNDTRPHR
jgi:hypothetical protein